MASRRKAVVLLSGGMDSATTAAIAKSEAFDIYALSFAYSQRHGIELDYAKALAAFLGIKKHLIIRFDLSEIGGSALTSEIEVPKNSGSRRSAQSAAGRSESIPVTYVPARNTIFLSFALAWAEVIGAWDIFIGANAVDYSGYPDCRPEYLRAFETMANLATKASVSGPNKFKIRAPLISIKKSGIVRKGIDLGVDYSLTWSCYDPQPARKPSPGPQKKRGSGAVRYALEPCGSCDSCRIRAKGFREAEIPDPLLESFECKGR